MKILKVIRKNLEVLIRSKSSALVVIFGPLLLILLVGLAFSNSSSLTLRLGYYTPEQNALTDKFILKLQNDSYSIKQFESQEACIESIKQTQIHACIVFPKGFEVAKPGFNQITFYVDQSKMNFVYAVKQSISSAISEQTSEVSMNLTGSVLDLLTVTKVSIEKEKTGSMAQAAKDVNEIASKTRIIRTNLASNKVDTSGVSSIGGSLDDASSDLIDAIATQKAYSLDASLLYWQFVDNSIAFTNESLKNQNINDFEEYKEDDTNEFSADDKFWQSWNASESARVRLINASDQLNQKTTQLVSNIQESETKQAQIATQLQTDVEGKAIATKTNLDGLSASMDNMIKRIDNLEVANAEDIVSPITSVVEPVTPEKSNLNYLFPSLMVLLIMFISVMLASTLVLMEKTSKAYLRNFTTPTSDFVFVSAIFLTSLFVMLIQILIVLGISAWAFHSPQLITNAHNILIIAFITAAIFILLGMILGYLFNSQETVMMGSISISSIFLLTSDTIFPLESMPIYIQSIAQFNPFIIAVSAFRKTIVYITQLDVVVNELTMLGFYLLLLILVLLIVQQMSKTQFLSRFGRMKIEKVDLVDIRSIFRVGAEPVKDLSGLIESIKNMTDKEFKTVVNRRIHYVADWADQVMNDLDLAKELRKNQNKKEIINFLLRKQGEVSINKDKKEKNEKKDKAKDKDDKDRKEKDDKEDKKERLEEKEDREDKKKKEESDSEEDEE